MRILVVDNDSVTRKLMARYLKAEGYEVALAEDADEALRQMERGDIDLVLTTMNNRPAHGAEIVRAVKSAPASGPVPVIALSSGAEEEQAALVSGADGCLDKPLNVETIKKKLVELLEIPRQREGVPKMNHRP